MAGQIMTSIKANWKLLLIILTPLLLAPLPICLPYQETYCGYVVLIMAVYWMTEVLPLAVTAFLPMFLYPAFGVLEADKVALNYLKDSNLVFVGSLIMAVAIEHSNLHERIALRILLFMGSNPRWLMLGFQLATAFLSMWMSNTATTAMMVPIAMAVVYELEQFRVNQNQIPMKTMSNNDGKDKEIAVMKTMSNDGNGKEVAVEEQPEFVFNAEVVPARHMLIYKGILLSICYSANIGGTGTLIGTGSNIVLSGQLKQIYGHTNITFASWMVYAIPPMLGYLFVSWFWLQTIFVGFRNNISGDSRVKTMLRSKYNGLGPMRFDEKMVTVLFCLLVVLFLFRDPKIFPGWGDLFEKGYMEDASAAMFIACLLFALPAEHPCRTADGKAPRTLMTWKVMQQKFSWSTVMLLGGGYAMAAGVTASGLSDLMARQMAILTAMPHWLFVAIAVTIVTFMTEFSSNVAAATIFIPILSGVANQVKVNPLYFVLPVTIACSFAFMLPVATPPNAIVFSSGLVHVMDMVKTGFLMNIACIALTMIFTHTWAWWLFDFGSVPNWALHAQNQTSLITTSMNPHTV